MSPLTRTIGSDMERVDPEFLLKSSALPPWARDGSTLYVETGRQALKILGDSLWDAGYRTLLVPAYLCESMLSPFLGNDWILRFVDVDRNFELVLDSLRSNAEAAKQPFVALIALYFGRLPDDGLREAVSEVRSLGGIVIDDETHRVFFPGGTGANFSLASLRKTLPVGDGAYIRGEIADVSSQSLPRRSNGRWEAMSARTQSAKSGDTSDSRRLFSEANKLLDTDRTAYAADPRSVEAVHHFDYAKLASSRISNATAFEDTLRGSPMVRVINPVGEGIVPSHAVIEIDNPRKVQASLASQGVFCPIHWPRPASLSTDLPWTDRILSVPIDHRYRAQEMVEVAQMVLSVVHR